MMSITKEEIERWLNDATVWHKEISTEKEIKQAIRRLIETRPRVSRDQAVQIIADIITGVEEGKSGVDVLISKFKEIGIEIGGEEKEA